jgi:MFS family permease
MTPGGWLIDRFGPSRMLALLAIGSTVLVAATSLPAWTVLPAAFALSTFLIVRALLGVVNVPMHPAAARAVSTWYLAPRRSWANGCVTAAALVGVAASYPVFGFLIDRFGWPGAFQISAAATMVLAIAWSLGASDGPIENDEPTCDDVARKSGKRAKSPTVVRSLMLLTASYAAVGYFQYLFFYWVQYYFEKVREVGPEKGRLLAMAPTLAMAAGMVLGGWWTHRLQERFGRWRGLAATPVLGMLAGAAFTVIGVFTQSLTGAVVCFALAMGAVGAAEGPFWTVAVAIGGRRGGTSAALFNTGGNAGGLLAPVLTPLFSERLGWQAGFSVASLLCLIGAVCWYWIDPRDCAMEENS